MVTKIFYAMKHSLHIYFILKKNKLNKKGLAPINVRIILDNKRFELSSNRSIEPVNWDNSTGKVISRLEKTAVINDYLNSLKIEIIRQYNIMESLGEEISSENLKSRLTGNKKKEHSLLEVFNYHNDEMKKQIGISFAKGTHAHYVSSIRKIVSFIHYRYSRSDIPLKKLDHSFLTSYEMYLKSIEKESHNTAMKHIKRLKKVIKLAIANEWLNHNPFSNYKITAQETHRGFLTHEELQTIETKSLPILRLAKVRDIFIFCCYTGLSFSDVEKLSDSDITTGIDGEKWLIIYRKKTGHRSPVPLLPQAKEILDKYKDDPESNAKGTLLPVNSNQRMNGYLKEIADISGIQKRLTMHLARHTFATTVTLANGVPIETVSKMLGHTSIKTTQIYSKVVDTKISNDMNLLKQKLAPALSINKAM